MNAEYIKIQGKTLQRVSKRKARKMFDSGAEVYVYACKVIPENPWISPALFLKGEEDDNFERHDNAFRYYNCSPEMGRYPKYYVEV